MDGKAIFILDGRTNVRLKAWTIYYAVYSFLFLEVVLSKKSTTLHRSSTDLASLINKVERWRRGGSLQRVFGVAEKSHCGMTLTSKDSCWWIQENVVG